MTSRLKQLALAATVAFAAVATSGCTDPQGAKETVEKTTELTNVQTGGYDWFSCSDKDWYATKFKAENKNGDTVNGVVCRGLLFKGSTIRYH